MDTTTTHQPTTDTSTEARLAASRARRAHRVKRSSLAWIEPLRQLNPDEAGDTLFADRDEINGVLITC